MVKTIKGDLILTKNTTFDEDLIVEGNIRCEGGCWDINAWDINARNINARDIDARNINARDIDAGNIDAGNIDARDISFYAFAIAYSSFKCKSWKAIRDKFVIKCLDGEIEITKPKVCDKCGAEIKESVK